MLLKLVGIAFLALTSINDVMTIGNDVDVSPVCKVNKNLINVYAGEAPGFVLVEGSSGCVTSTSLAAAYAKNLISGDRAEITLKGDMSFSVQLKANPGDKIRVHAQNIEGKRSYGTFDIAQVMPAKQIIPKPIPLEQGQAVLAVKEYDLPSDQNKAETSTVFAGELDYNKDPENGTNLAVIIMVVNTDTGKVLATTQVEGKSKAYAEKSDKNFTIMLSRITDRCRNIIESEIFRPNFKRNESELDSAVLETPVTE